LLAFGRRQALQKTSRDLNEVVAQLLKMIRRLIGEHIEVEFLPGADLRPCRCDRAQVEQVLLNLCVNARDAMPNGGRIEIRSDNVVLDAAYRERHPWAVPGRYVALRVSDNGSGMDPDTLERVFEPFFTTKTKDKGTGLGLAVVYGVVKQHDGLIEVQSEPGKGTAFTIYLPAKECRAPGGSPPVRPGGSLKGSETILLAEDEPAVRQLAVRVLESAGYRVLAACNGEEAVRVFADQAATVDLALLDVVMPRMGGPEAYERMARLKPALPVILCSGYSGPAPEVGSDGAEQPSLLTKPYTPEELLRRIRDLFEERSASNRRIPSAVCPEPGPVG
jgi:two-component system, cell cycle sensor histidine kinase and response regulator CckA